MCDNQKRLRVGVVSEKATLFAKEDLWLSERFSMAKHKPQGGFYHVRTR